jgi:hypothetical protein
VPAPSNEVPQGDRCIRITSGSRPHKLYYPIGLDIAKNVFQVHGIDAAEKVVVAFAVRAPEGTLRVCLINQNITRDERVAIDLERKFTAASMLRLAGPAIDATAGVTFGGASVDELERWAPTMNEEVRLTGHEFIVDVQAASATSIVARVISFPTSNWNNLAQSAVRLRLWKIAILHPREGAVTSSRRSVLLCWASALA